MQPKVETKPESLSITCDEEAERLLEANGYPRPCATDYSAGRIHDYFADLRIWQGRLGKILGSVKEGRLEGYSIDPVQLIINKGKI